MNLQITAQRLASHSKTCAPPRPVTFSLPTASVKGQCPTHRGTNACGDISPFQPWRVLGTTNRRRGDVSRASAKEGDYVEVKVDTVSVSLGACVVFLRLIAAPELVLPVHVGGWLELVTVLLGRSEPGLGR